MHPLGNIYHPLSFGHGWHIVAIAMRGIHVNTFIMINVSMQKPWWWCHLASTGDADGADRLETGREICHVFVSLQVALTLWNMDEPTNWY